MNWSKASISEAIVVFIEGAAVSQAKIKSTTQTFDRVAWHKP
ncbi:hypothetical protein [Sphaerospermopsis sp. LEGE 08334]|nr:hypothetical protein [Sphaerospermopsis sp. LEGE 08334]